MNRYSSTGAFLRARNLFEGTIAPPADFTVAAATCKKQLFTQVSPLATPAGEGPNELNFNSNILIRSIGIYSNFADGLVFKNASNRFDVKIGAANYSASAFLAGSVTFTEGTKQVDGAGTFFTTGAIPLVAGDIIKLGTAGPAGGERYYVVDYIDPVLVDTRLFVTDYLKDTIGGAGRPVVKMIFPVAGSQQNYYCEDIGEMNMQFPIDKYMYPSLYGGAGGNETIITVELNVIHPDYRVAHDTVFMTKSVNVAFAGDPCFFDAGIELEYTRA